MLKTTVTIVTIWKKICPAFGFSRVKHYSWPKGPKRIKESIKNVQRGTQNSKMFLVEALYPRGGGSLIFFAYVDSDPASTVHPKKNIRNFKHPQKIFEILAAQKNIPILCLDLKKDPKLHRNDLQTSPILWWPPKNIHKIFIPPKNIHLKTKKNIEIQNFEPKKWAKPTYVWK